VSEEISAFSFRVKSVGSGMDMVIQANLFLNPQTSTPKEAECPSETTASAPETIRCHNPEDYNLKKHQYVNLKTYTIRVYLNNENVVLVSRRNINWATAV
jgi:hypothetical protein